MKNVSLANGILEQLTKKKKRDNKIICIGGRSKPYKVLYSEYNISQE
jgi:hypothetical protein